MKIKYVIAFSMLLVASLSAQTTRVVPNVNHDLEGFSSFSYPWGYKDFRFQEVVDAGQIAQKVALISSMGFRGHGGNLQVNPGFTGTYDIRFYYTWVTPISMSKTFSQNLGTGKGTQVFNGKLVLPTIPLPASRAAIPLAFTFKIPLIKPFQYSPGLGNLLIDIKNTESSTATGWGVDTVRQSTISGGHEGYVGIGCRGFYNEELTLGIDEHQLQPGGVIKVTGKFQSVTNAMVWLGYSRTGMGPLPLPFNFGPLGASRCHLYCNMLSPLPVTPVAPSCSWPIPPGPIFGGAKLYLQGLALAPKANSLGAVFSDGHYVKLGSGGFNIRGCVQCLWKKPATATIGVRAGSMFCCGPVVLFQGVFN